MAERGDYLPGPGFRADALHDRRRAIIAEHVAADSYQPDSVFPVQWFFTRDYRVTPAYRVRVGEHLWLRAENRACRYEYPPHAQFRVDAVQDPHEATIWSEPADCANERLRLCKDATVEVWWWLAGTVYRTRELAEAALSQALPMPMPWRPDR